MTATVLMASTVTEIPGAAGFGAGARFARLRPELSEKRQSHALLNPKWMLFSSEAMALRVHYL
jgi:hypothetical protein